MGTITRRRRALWLISAVAVAASTLGITGVGQPRAAAEPQHTISGFVVGKLPDGDRYSADVYVYYRLFNGELQEADRAETDETGVYSLTVFDGTYYVLVVPTYYDGEPRAGGVNPQWYLGAPSEEAATPIVVNGENVQLSDVALKPPPRLSGSVMNEQGQPVLGAHVQVVPYAGVYTDTDGPGVLTGPGGSYDLWAGGFREVAVHVGDPYHPFAWEWFLDQSLARNATPLSVLTDTVLPPIVVGRGGTVAGRIVGSDGFPVRKSHVELISADTFQDAGDAYTDATGYYRITTLPPGRYLVRFGGGWDYDTEDHTVDHTNPLTVLDHTTTSANATLQRRARPPQPGNAVEGRVVDAQGRPLGGVRVLLAHPGDQTDDPLQMTKYAEDRTEPDGTYRLVPSGLDPGDQVVVYVQDGHTYDVYRRSQPTDLVNDMVPVFYPGVQHIEAATPIAVPQGTLQLADVTVQEYGGVAGRALLPDGSSPWSRGAEVRAYDEQGKVVSWAVVQQDGHYYLSRLRPGTYRFWFGGDHDPALGGPYLQNWWSGGTSFATATAVEIEAGQVVTDVSATVVPRSRTYTGRVVGGDGQPLAGVYINPSRADGETLYVARPYTDRDGRFTLTLLPGQYKVRIGVANDPRFRATWLGGGNSSDTAAVLDVPEGQPPLDLGDIRVSSYPAVSGRVTSATGVRLSRVRVQPYLPDGTPVGAGASTVGDGSYLLRLPAGGEYRLGFLPPGSTMPTQYFHDATSLATATPIILTDEQQLTGVDEQFLGPTPPPPPTTAPTTPPAPMASATAANATYKEKRRPQRSRAVLDIDVRLAGVAAAATGAVTVTDRGRVVALVSLVNGQARIVVKHPKRRVHTYVVTYLGNPGTSASTTSVRLDAR